MNPLSSTLAVKGSVPIIYDLREDSLVVTNTESGESETLFAQYQNVPVPEDEFSSKTAFVSESFPLPSLSGYKDRWLCAVFTDQYGAQYGLYRMDSEIWLCELREIGVWSIFRLQRIF